MGPRYYPSAMDKDVANVPFKVRAAVGTFIGVSFVVSITAMAYGVSLGLPERSANTEDADHLRSSRRKLLLERSQLTRAIEVGEEELMVRRQQREEEARQRALERAHGG